MKFGIYQSYVKQPQKFFAPSGPCRSNFNNRLSRHIRRVSCSDTPVYYWIAPPAIQEFQIEKPKESKKAVKLNINKVELVLEDFSGAKTQKFGKFKEEFVGLRRPNTSKALQAVQVLRPFTGNVRFVRKS